MITLITCLRFFVCLELLGTVDFVASDGTIVFRTCEEERDKVVFQVVRRRIVPPNMRRRSVF